MLFFIPTLSSIFMATMLCGDIVSANGRDRQLKFRLLLCILSWMLCFSTSAFYFFIPKAYVYLRWLFYSALLVQPVFFYRFLFEIARIRRDERFSPLHYAIPFSGGLFMFVILFVVPYQEQFRTVIDYGAFSGTQDFFGIVFGGMVCIKAVLDVYYITLCYANLRRYRRFIVDRSIDEGRLSLRWGYRYMLLIIISFGITVFAIVLSRDGFVSSPFVLILFASVTIMQVYLSYHVIKGHNILLDIDEPAFVETGYKDASGMLKKSLLTKAYFEEYMRTSRPYLNPDLKISDLVNDLHVNRTYISGFINREYDMNFSQYINQCRMEEYRRLLVDPDLKNKNAEELSVLAGFGSYRYFLRLEKDRADKDAKTE